METTSPLAVESFSDSWLSNINLSFNGLDEEPRRAAHESSSATTQNFHFDIQAFESHVSLLHADELFSDGLIKPLLVVPLAAGVSNTADSISSFCVSSKSVTTDEQISGCFLGRWRKVSKRILQKFFGHLIVVLPLCHKIEGPKKSSKVDDIGRRTQAVKSWNNSPQISPRLSRVYSAGDWYDIESSINDAVLHCKRSIGK
ncbi:hypothetical protein FNV43_RR18220 [Rhamnella rubrinervis]|uniref:Membrane-associated kinase regulator 6 n=1 Tax=Rhamnella rubrinervis TaxID=2594499 RepID=A0A8K0EAS9_9ROSA|nr:hypothetical protein FNV43_RR18220 [Rhamnella rubrinervis]